MRYRLHYYWLCIIAGTLLGRTTLRLSTTLIAAVVVALAGWLVLWLAMRRPQARPATTARQIERVRRRNRADLRSVLPGRTWRPW
jgi:hypothetical protein